MPSRYEPRPQPYGYSSYQGGDRILDLIMRQGQIQAEGAQRSSEIWGNALSGIGQTLAGGIQQHQEQRAQSRRSAAFTAAIQSGDPRQILSVLGPRDGPAVITALRTTTEDGLKGYKDRMEIFRDGARGLLASPEGSRPEGYVFLRDSYIRNGVAKPEELPNTYEEAVTQGILDTAANYGQEPAKAQGLTSVAPNNTLYDPASREAVFTAPAAPKEEKRHMVTVPGPGGRPITRLATEEELAEGVPAYREPRAQQDGEPLVAVIGDDGQSVLVPRRQAAGRRPASNREQSSTGAEKTALSFYNDARQAANDADAVADKLGNSFQLKYAPNIAQTEEQQQYWQAVRSFTEARLRKRSGAAIPEYEIEKDAKMYFQQPGDSESVLKQKKASRERTIDGIRIESGRAYAEYYGEPVPRNQPGATDPGPARPIPPGAAPGAAPAAGGRPAPPTQGEQRTINGQLAEWDGRGWLPVRR